MDILKVGAVVSIVVTITLICCCIDDSNKETSNENYTIGKLETPNNISEVGDNNKIHSITERVETPNNTDDINTTNNLENNSNGKIYIMYPRIVNYTILEYGKYSDRENLDHYIYLDISRNRTIIFIYGGKKSFDYDLSVDKIVEYSRGNITVYIKERYGRDPIITSPYLVIEIKGIVNNTNIEYIN